MVLLEAMAAGVPLLATACGGAMRRQRMLSRAPCTGVCNAAAASASPSISARQTAAASVKVTSSTFILQAGRRHSSGLWCYPEARDVARLAIEDLTSRKFSRAKAETVLRLAHLVDDGALSLELPPSGEVAAISQALLAVKGIGPWTVNYALLRGYGHADCSLHGDVAIRAALQKLLGEESKPDMARTEQWLRQYAPHRTMAAAHLWASLHAPEKNILPVRE